MKSYSPFNPNLDDGQQEDELMRALDEIESWARENSTKSTRERPGGELGVDAGGPKREFFRLLMVALRGSAVFQGPWFSHGLNLLSSNKYAEAGKFIAWSALQGGNGPRCLSEEGYNLVRGRVSDKASAIEAVCDADMKLILEALAAAESDCDFSEVANKYSDAIAQYGYSRIYTSKFVNKEEIIDCLLKQYFIYGVHSEFTQFLAGMNSIDIMMAHKSVFEAIFGNKQEKLTTSKFKSLYQVDYAERI
ncbi:hypothetical protein QZH41_000629 [Actinostola sp. cb2023]|nr:hypothetical protein QZH41_000629 [Actinostola sp. cb2023]